MFGREPQARYRSAGDLAEDLERWLEGRPIVARPVSPPVRIWRWSKRNPKLASAAAACAVLGVSAAVVSLSSARVREIVRGEAAAARSVGVLPVEDLDEVRTDSLLARNFTNNSERASVARPTLVSFRHPKGRPKARMFGTNKTGRALAVNSEPEICWAARSEVVTERSAPLFS